MRELLILLIFLVGMLLVGCQPAVAETTTSTPTVQIKSSTSTERVSPPMLTDTPATLPPVSPATVSTLTPWEVVQQTLQSLQGLLDRTSDGYAGLALALEQPAANETWCASLAAAVNDFLYLGDRAQADLLSEISADQGCP